MGFYNLQTVTSMTYSLNIKNNCLLLWRPFFVEAHGHVPSVSSPKSGTASTGLTACDRVDGQGDVEKKEHQLYRRPYMMG